MLWLSEGRPFADSSIPTCVQRLLGMGTTYEGLNGPSRFSCITQFDSDRCPLPDEAIIAAFISKKKHVAVRLQKDLQICLTPIVVDGGSQLSGVQPPPCQ